MQRCAVSDFVRGDLVSLRPWGVADAQWYADELKDPDIQRFTSDPADLTAESVAAAIEARHGGSDLSFLIVDAVTGRRLGNLAVDLEGSAGMVSYWMSSSTRGRGSATSAIKLLVGWLHDRAEPLDELRLWTHIDNRASQVVALRAGFVRDPTRDGLREITGAIWETAAFRLDLRADPFT